MTDYEDALAEMAGRTGIRQGRYAALRRKVLAAIAARYPVLSAECARQATPEPVRHAGGPV